MMRTGLTGSRATTTTAETAPMTASITRGTSSPRWIGERVAISTAVPPAWVTTAPPRLMVNASRMARVTTVPICQGPVPMTMIRASPTSRPASTPTSSSRVRRVRRPIAAAIVPTAALGANTGEG